MAHWRTHARTRLPGSLGGDAADIDRTFGLTRDLTPSAELR